MMQTNNPTELLKRKLAKLSTKDVLDIQTFVADLVSQQATDVALERRSADTKTCLHCGEAKIQRWGRSKAERSGSSARTARRPSAPRLARRSPASQTPSLVPVSRANGPSRRAVAAQGRA